MLCDKCGADNKDNAIYCKNCGYKFDHIEAETESSNPGPEGNLFSSGKKRWIILIIIIVVAIVITGLVLLYMSTSGNKDKNENADTNQQESVDDSYIEEDDSLYIDFDSEETISIDGFATVDFYEQNHSPNAKEKDMEWDEKLFYELEEGDGENSGLISQCSIFEYCFIDDSDKKEITCEVYVNNNNIYKIVTIKEADDGQLEITDYYYYDNKPNFVFYRKASVYTPTYATLDKPGLRLYFNNDVLVRSRVVEEGTLKVSQTGLKMQRNRNYEEFDYFRASETIREQYDNYEIEWLNKAYNIYDAINDKNHIGKVYGKVVDSAGNNLVNAKIAFVSSLTGELVYWAEADNYGMFTMYVMLNDVDYKIYISYAGNTLEYNNLLCLSSNTAVYDLKDIIIFLNNKDQCRLVMNIYDGETYRDDTEEGISAQVNIREGINNKDGACIVSVQTDSSGQVTAELPSGNYTCEIINGDYITEYVNISLQGTQIIKSCFLVKRPVSDTATILMTWDTTDDIDLAIFTPYQGMAGDMEMIGGMCLNDDHDNYIYSDNKNGCEIGHINLSETGHYKVYVCDYRNICGNEYNAETLKNCNLKIYVFFPDGHVEVYEPTSTNGVVWEAVEISRAGISIRNHVYNKLSGDELWLDSIVNKTGSNMSISGAVNQDIVKKGITYCYGIEVTQDYAKAKELFEKAADMGNPAAMNMLGAMYYYGVGIEIDYIKAKEWYEKASDCGNIDAMCTLGYIYSCDLNNESDYAKALSEFKKASDLGNAKATKELANMYCWGMGCECDKDMAKELYEKAADLGNADAMEKLGSMYYCGDGVKQDYAKARELYEKAVELGNGYAMSQLGNMYYRGVGVAQNMELGLELCDKANEIVYPDGPLVRENGKMPYIDDVVEVLEEMANDDNISAILTLADMYSNDYQRIDYDKAVELYEKAADLGDASAKEKLKMGFGE